MTAVEPMTATYRPAEHHRFTASGADYLYLVPSAAIFALDGLSREIFDLLSLDPMGREELVARLARNGHAPVDAESTIDEMAYYDVLDEGDRRPKVPSVPAGDFPLQRLVLNVTNQCNLSCGYCYEYSADKITIT